MWSFAFMLLCELADVIAYPRVMYKFPASPTAPWFGKVFIGSACWDFNNIREEPQQGKPSPEYSV